MADSNIIEIVNGIAQAAANAYDGALDDKGQPIKIGLQREEGNPILDRRVMDGFNVKISGNILTINYQSQISLKEVYMNDFEGEIAQRLEDIASFLKKEYRRIKKSSLSLTKHDKEPNVYVQSMNKRHSWCNASQTYKIGGIPDNPELGTTVEERLNNSIKNWIGFGKEGFSAKAPENVSGKRDEEPRE